MRTYRSVSMAAFAVAVSALVGGFFGGRVLATQDGVPERINVFTAALKQIEQKYVESVDVRSRGLQRDQRHAPDARSPLEFHGSEGLRSACASARKGIITVLASAST